MFNKIIGLLLGKPVGYVSPADTFLQKLRRKNPTPSASQEKEIIESARIAELRDGRPQEEVNTELWRDF